MIALTIYNFFKFMKLSYESLYDYNINSLLVSNNLKDELLKQQEFFHLWRNKLSFQVSNERFKIKKLKLERNNKISKVIVTIEHSFKINNTSPNLTSKEMQYYIFIIKKTSKGHIILNYCNKESHPILYNKLLSSSNYNENDIFLSKSRIDFWNKKIHSIDTLIDGFNHQFSQYRSIYTTDYPRKYNYLSAIEYARKHAFSYNKNYISFDEDGGDCTNFVSQCIRAGSINTSHTWKPYTHSWIRVNELYYYLLKNNVGIDITNKNNYPPGSIIQFFSNKKGYFSHSGIITETLANGDYLYCCHSYDKLDFPLSQVYPLYYDKLRIIEVL